MADQLGDSQWRDILELANAAADFPADQRRGFLESSGHNAEVVDRVLQLAQEFELPAEHLQVDIGSRVGRFTVTGRVGRGGMGQVFSAQDPELGRTVALKVLVPEACSEPGSEDRMVREARTASALNHPNIVTIFEIVRVGSAVAIVMEFVPGASLGSLVGKVPEATQYLDILRQIANAIDAAHAAGVAHRDIKPENVIVRPDGHVKVLDFGLARVLTGKAASVSVTKPSFAGTLAYMPPEQCTGSDPTAAGDIFSLGTVFYELITGHHPFRADSPFATMQAIVESTQAPSSTLNPAISPALDSLILAMLAKLPSERPSASDVVRSLEMIQHALNTAETRVPLGRFPFVRDRFKYAAIRKWTVTALGLLVIAAGLIYWAYRRNIPRLADFRQMTSLLPSNRPTAAAISHDARLSVYANADGLFLRSMDTWETQALQAPRDFVVDHLAWYPDGTKLAVSGFSAIQQAPSVWVVSLTGTPARMLTDKARYGVPSPDGRSLAFLSADGSEIWVAAANGERPVKLVAAQEGDNFPLVFWSSTGRSVLFQRRHFSGRDPGFVMLDRYYERSLESVDIQSHKIAFRVPDLWMESAAMLPDGRLRFLRFDEPGSQYSNELWEVSTDPLSGSFRGGIQMISNPVATLGGFVKGFSSSEDGSQAMVIRSTNEDAVYVADYHSVPPKFSNSMRLTLDTRKSFPHGWSGNSAVIFESDRNGTWDIFRQRPDQRTATPIVANRDHAEVMPRVTPDGKSILYATGPDATTAILDTIMRVPIEGGTPVQVLKESPLGEFRCGVRSGRCVLRRSIGQKFYVFYELDPVRGVGRELTRTPWSNALVGDWDISPDGSHVALPNHELKSATIRVISLDGHREEALTLPGLSDLSGLTWAADGSGWFVTLNTSVGFRMLYIYVDGRVHPIGNIQGWAVPSPDGHRVAYRDRTVAADAWLMVIH